MCQIINGLNSKNKPLGFVIIFAFLISCKYAVVDAGNIQIPLGIVFEQGTKEVQTAFKHALLTFSLLNISANPGDLYRLTAYVDTINTADAFKLSKLICNQFSRGIYSMLGMIGYDSFHTYHAFADTFHMPFITPWYPIKDSAPSKSTGRGSGKNELTNYATRLRPDLKQVILDTIHYYGWKEVIYLYSSNEGLMRLQTLFYRSTSPELFIRVKLVKKISNAKEAIAILKDVESAERFSQKFVLLDCPTTLAKDIIINHVRDVHLGRRTYHYMLTGLAFDEDWETNILEFNAVNITGFRMVDPNRRFVKDFLQKWSKLDNVQFEGAGKTFISTNAALMYDAMLIIKEAFTDILIDNPFALQRYGDSYACDSGSDFMDDIRFFEHGQIVNQHLRRVQTEGLTGNIQFHENGTRKYFTVDVIELRTNSSKFKIGQWSDFSGFKTELPQHITSANQELNNKNVYVVSSILEEPYLMMKKRVPGKHNTGNDVYEGYTKDLADLIFQNLGLKYRIQLVKDGKYGIKTPTSFGDSWNGIIGELVRKEVDIAIAPLTISSERERVVEFTKPFLTQGISIMVYKPTKKFPGLFSFMNPLSDFVWIGVLGAYLSVSGTLYIIYKLTSCHQRQVAQRISDDYDVKYSGGQTYIQNPSNNTNTQNPSPPDYLTLSNVLWMSFSILSHQNRGNSIAPRSLAARLASTVWWLFALILVSVYTGNYIALRMKNKASTPIRSAWDLVDLSGIQYGTLSDGATYEFFKNSETQVYKAIFQHISGPYQSNVRTYEEGIKMVRQKKGKYAFLIESAKNEYISNKKPCNTMKVGPDITDVNYGIGLPIGSPFTQKVNLEILRLKEVGALRQLEDKWWLNKAECHIAGKLDEMENTLSDDELSLGSLAGIFYILIVGMVIAIFVSFLEFFCSSKKEDLRSNKLSVAETMVQMNSNNVAGTVPNDFRDIPTDLSSK